MSTRAPTLDFHTLRGGAPAIRNALQGTLALAAMALVLVGPAPGLAFLLSHDITLKRGTRQQRFDEWGREGSPM